MGLNWAGGLAGAAEGMEGLVKLKQDEHPDIDIRIAPYIGGLDGITGLMLEAAG